MKLRAGGGIDWDIREENWYLYKKSKGISFRRGRVSKFQGLLDELLGFSASDFNSHAFTFLHLIIICIVICCFHLHLHLQWLHYFCFQVHYYPQHHPYLTFFPSHNNLTCKISQQKWQKKRERERECVCVWRERRIVENENK